jgi:hypothetical protein
VFCWFAGSIGRLRLHACWFADTIRALSCDQKSDHPWRSVRFVHSRTKSTLMHTTRVKRGKNTDRSDMKCLGKSHGLHDEELESTAAHEGLEVVG